MLFFIFFSFHPCSESGEGMGCSAQRGCAHPATLPDPGGILAAFTKQAQNAEHLWLDIEFNILNYVSYIQSIFPKQLVLLTSYSAAWSQPYSLLTQPSGEPNSGWDSPQQSPCQTQPMGRAAGEDLSAPFQPTPNQL